MCVVSMVHDWGRTYPEDKRDYEWAKELQRMLEDAKKLDEKMGQPDCVDPKKAELVKEILDILEKKGLLKK